MRAGRQLLATIALLFALAMSLSYVIPNAQALDADTAVAAPEAQTFSVDSAPTAVTVTRDAYGVTVPPPIQWPLPPDTAMSSDFGPRSCSGCSSNHEGVDLNAPGGTPVKAMAAGVVIETSAAGYAALGVHVRIQHLIDGEVVTSVYAHLQSGSMPFAVGDYVTAGQVVGAVGCTGTCTGDHLHFEVRPGGEAAADPWAWLHSKLG